VVTFDHLPAGKIPPPNNDWDTVVKDYGYCRISKKEGSGVIIQGFHYEFKKGTILEFRVGENNTDLKYNNSDVINKSEAG
jgi:hypothetical protein